MVLALEYVQLCFQINNNWQDQVTCDLDQKHFVGGHVVPRPIILIYCDVGRDATLRGRRGPAALNYFMVFRVHIDVWCQPACLIQASFIRILPICNFTLIFELFHGLQFSIWTAFRFAGFRSDLWFRLWIKLE